MLLLLFIVFKSQNLIKIVIIDEFMGLIN
jgi:hypothetical protein